jgi:hypothetical protein
MDRRREMKISKLAIILAVLVMPLVISCSDGGDAFDVTRNENPDPNGLDYTYTQEHITDLSCDADNECPEELSCWGLEGMGGALCVDPNPEEWFCEEGTVPTVFSSYPPSLICDEEEEVPPEEGPIDEPELCDADTPCSEGLECWVLPDDEVAGAQCVEPSPNEWYCPEGTEPIVGSSYPPVLSCQEEDSEEAIADDITDTACTSDADCPEQYECWTTPETGAVCMKESPMEWYCDDVEGSFAVKFMSSPPEIRCMFLIID